MQICWLLEISALYFNALHHGLHPSTTPGELHLCYSLYENRPCCPRSSSETIVRQEIVSIGPFSVFSVTVWINELCPSCSAPNERLGPLAFWLELLLWEVLIGRFMFSWFWSWTSDPSWRRLASWRCCSNLVFINLQYGIRHPISWHRFAW